MTHHEEIIDADTIDNLDASAAVFYPARIEEIDLCMSKISMGELYDAFNVRFSEV